MAISYLFIVPKVEVEY